MTSRHYATISHEMLKMIPFISFTQVQTMYKVRGQRSWWTSTEGWSNSTRERLTGLLFQESYPASERVTGSTARLTVLITVWDLFAHRKTSSLSTFGTTSIMIPPSSRTMDFTLTQSVLPDWGGYLVNKSLSTGQKTPSEREQECQRRCPHTQRSSRLT